MSRVADAVAPMEQVYSLAEYQGQQKAVEEQKRADVRNELNLARENLKGGNLRQAVSSYNRSKTKGQQLKQELDENRDLAQIESEVRRAQVSNLIVAQNSFYYDNSARLNGGQVQVMQVPALNAPVQQQAEVQQRAQPQGAINFDADVAGQQWDKLQKAQQVAVAKVAPLRVNLPTRGVRYSFAQVLQTESSKPLTIQFRAENTKMPAWGTRLMLGLVCFGVIWMGMGLMMRGASRRGLEPAQQVSGGEQLAARPLCVFCDQQVGMSRRLFECWQGTGITGVAERHTDISEQAFAAGALQRRAGEALLEAGFV